jgi:hypothetical protein
MLVDDLAGTEKVDLDDEGVATDLVSLVRRYLKESADLNQSATAS